MHKSVNLNLATITVITNTVCRSQPIYLYTVSNKKCHFVSIITPVFLVARFFYGSQCIYVYSSQEQIIMKWSETETKNIKNTFSAKCKQIH